MNILDARLEYWSGTDFSNSPSAEILVDRVPDMDEFRYTFMPVDKTNPDGGRYYYAELNGFVSFFFARGPYTEEDGVVLSNPDQGYGGRHFKLQMVNGETHILRGPWSSNSSAMRIAGFPICVEVSYTDDPEAWKRGYTFFAGAVSREAMRQISLALPKDDDMHSWVWVENEYGGLMPGLVKSTHDKLAGRIYTLTEE